MLVSARATFLAGVGFIVAAPRNRNHRHDDGRQEDRELVHIGERLFVCSDSSNLIRGPNL